MIKNWDLCVDVWLNGPIKVHVDNKRILDGLWRGERICIDPNVGDADLCQKFGKSCIF